MRARLIGNIAVSIISLAIVIGMPVFLYHVVGSRWPARGPTLHDWNTLNLRGDSELLLGGLAVVGWALWAVFTVIVLYAVVGATYDVCRYGIAAETWRDASNPIRWLAGLLIGAVAALWPTAVNAAPPEPVDQTVADRTLTDEEIAETTCTNPAASTVGTEEEGETSTHVIGPGDSLFSLAATYLGDGNRWPEIWDLNRGITMSNGKPFTNPDFITDGTKITIPAGEEAVPGPEAQDQNTKVHIVRTGQHLYGLAQQYLGDGERWPEIWEANRDRVFDDGRTFTDPDRIFPKWDLLIPIGTPTPGADDSESDTDAEPDPEPGHELEGEGEITDPDDQAAAPEPTEPADEPSSADDETTAPADSATPANDGSNAPTESVVPVGVWLSAGTFLAAATIVTLAARFRAKRRRPRRRRPVPERLSGRLTDLEAIVTHEGLAATSDDTDPADADDHNIPFGTDFSVTTALTDLARPLLGLLGPGQGGAARAAIAAALANGQSVTITTTATEYTHLDRATEHLPGSAIDLADDLEAVLSGPLTENGATGLIVCAAPDVDAIGVDDLADRAEHSGARLLVLSGRPEATLTLAADGTVESAEGDAARAGLERCYIADVATVEALITGLAESIAPSPSVPVPTSQRVNDTDEVEIDLDDLIDPAEYAAPVLGMSGPATASAARAAVASVSYAGDCAVITAHAAIALDEGEPWPTNYAVDIIAPDFPAAMERAQNSLDHGAAGTLLVCTDADTAGEDPDALAQQIGAANVRVLILGPWSGAAITLDASGVITETTGVTLPQWPSGSFLCDPPEMMDALEKARDRGFGITDWIAQTAEAQVPEQPSVPPEPDAAPLGTTLRLCVFGYPSVYLDDQPVALKQGRRALALLTTLALDDTGQGRTRDDLLGAVLWDEPMGSAKKYLPTIVNDTRTDLCRAAGLEKTEDKFIVYDKRIRRYRLEADRFTIDRDEFDTLEQDAALAEDDDQRIELLSRAVSLYAGDLADQMEIDTLTELRSQYRDAVRRACRTLVDHYEAYGDPTRANSFRRIRNNISAPVPETKRT
jgi:hypothetical protein